MAMVAACQLIAGALVGDWMHTSQIVTSVQPSGVDWLSWENQQVDQAFDLAADVIQGWSAPATVRGSLGEGDASQDDDGSSIPPGGARITTEYGLWDACVWTKTISAATMKPDEGLNCRTYDKLAASGRLSDDSPGDLAPTPSSSNFMAAQVFAVIGASASGLAVLLLGAVTFMVGNESGGLDEEEEEKWEEEPLGTCCANRGPRFPSSGCTGRLTLAGGLLIIVAILASLGALAAWADSQAAQDLAKLPAASGHTISFAFGSSFIIVGLGAACGVASVILLAAGYCWFKDKPDRTAGGSSGLLKGGASADYVPAPDQPLSAFEAAVAGPDDDDAKGMP